MTQLTLPLADELESKSERMLRVLAGVPEVKRASVLRTFTPEAEREAERLARGEGWSTDDQVGPRMGLWVLPGS